MPAPDDALTGEALVANWDQVLRVREEVLKVLEISRKPPEGEGILGHIIGHSLDAEILFFPDMYDSSSKAVLTARSPQTWEDIFIVSKVKVESGQIPDSFGWDQEDRLAGSIEIIRPNGREGRMYDSPLLSGPIVVFKAQGQKCERCWKYGEDVKEPSKVCSRCSKVLRSGVSS
jgi:isoleucyl-tRNA synthetase